jgi:hypothetical protein
VIWEGEKMEAVEPWISGRGSRMAWANLDVRWK